MSNLKRKKKEGIKDFLELLKESYKKISLERDKIRDILDDHAFRLESANEGLEQLEYAIEKLSEGF